MLLLIDTSSPEIGLALHLAVFGKQGDESNDGREFVPLHPRPCGGGRGEAAGGGFNKSKYQNQPHHQEYKPYIRTFAKNMREEPTSSEKKFWQAVRNKKLGGFIFRRQRQFDNKYIADFVCYEKKLIVEIDGIQHYENKKDEIRTEYLQKFGFNVVRFWNWDINKNLEGCLEVVRDILTNDSFEKRLAEFEKNLPDMRIDERGNVFVEPTPRGFAATPAARAGVERHEFSAPIAVKHIPTEKQSLSLPVETERFLNENGVAWRDITAVGVIVGPGSFTGIRLGIAYAKGIAMGLDIPVVPVNAFEIYLRRDPDAFVAIESGKGDFFIGARDLPPQIMTIEEVEAKQFDYAKTVGHKPYGLADASIVAARKLKSPAEPVIPLYIRPHYAEVKK